MGNFVSEAVRKITLSAGLMLALSGCGSTIIPAVHKNDAPLFKVGKVKYETDHEIVPGYFPLTVGNSWTYLRTINRQSEVRFSLDSILTKAWNEDNTSDTELSFLSGHGLQGKAIPASSLETYTVTEKIGDYFVVHVKGDTPRDGRYTVFGSDCKERVCWKALDKGIIEEVIDLTPAGLPLSKNFVANMNTQSILESEMSASPSVQIVSLRYKGSFESFAGKFDDCVINHTLVRVRPFNTINGNNLWTGDPDAYAVRQIFAKGVGLISEVQATKKGVTYSLNLESYKVVDDTSTKTASSTVEGFK